MVGGSEMGREEGEWECVASIAVPGSFDLEKAVCSHGLFMMAPNRWDPSTRALMRPLRLSDSSLSVMTRISSSSSSSSSSCLNLQVLNPPPPPLSPQDRGWLQSQVERMLRLSDAEERNLKEFHRIHPEAKARGFARVFRSPTLFEDMVKCILLCNCQWPRTLTMAKALCQFQLDLKSATSKTNEDFLLVVPSTPAATREPTTTTTTSRRRKRSSPPKLNHTTTTTTTTTTDTDHQPPMPSTSDHETIGIGDFPTPEELANIDPNVLGRRCNLGYRAPRIVKLAQSITRGELQLQQLQQQQQQQQQQALLHGPSSSLVYDRLAKQLMKIDGFGPFTCANVLVCMGFYQVIPIDTETIRHIKTVHAPSCTTKTVQNDVHKVYAKYAPFQFLAYWSELWEFYEKWFGKTSDMPSSSYHLITASNMKASKHKKTNNHI